jgi:hypothetical protein
MQHNIVASAEGRVAMFDALFGMSMLSAECQQVIGMRLIKAAFGGAAAADEAALMLSEKLEAAARHGPALMAGGSLGETIEDYRKIVRANAVRLAEG